MTKRNLSWKRIGTDAVGYLCLLGVILFGWLPGPGGIPLLITGLGLLSIYNPWAKRLLKFVQKHSQSIKGLVFTNNKWVKLTWDLLTIGLVVSGTIIEMRTDNIFIRGIEIALYFLATAIFLFNRNRIEWFKRVKNT